MQIDPQDTPQLRRLSEVEREYTGMLKFLEWLRQQDIELLRLQGTGVNYECDHYPDRRPDERLVAEFLGLDLDALQLEKQRLYSTYMDHIRKEV